MEKFVYESDLPDKELEKDWVRVVFDVLEKLPVDVQTKLRNEVTVFFAYNQTGSFIESKKKLIYLNCFQMEKVNMPLWAKRYIVAHEFAHAYSGSRDEKVAILQMMEWRFRDFERYRKWTSILQINLGILLKNSK